MLFVAKKSLFDLIKSNENDADQSIYLTEKNYIDSIIQSIQDLLNTRCIFPLSKRKSYLPLNYGLPYFFGMQEPDDLMNPTNQERWKITLERTLRYFEPRLLRPKVTIQHINLQHQSIEIEIKGNIILNDCPKRTSFAVTINNPY